MRKSINARLGLFVLFGITCCASAFAQDAPKVPIQSDDKGSVYVAPNVSSTETAIDTKGATVGVQQKDGSAVYTGVDTSTPQPTYSVGGSTGGNTSFSAGVNSDGKENKAVKAGITIKY
ncbi:hypothetical protein BH11PSE13_BH11PSE13_38900 [soil metagenome]